MNLGKFCNACMAIPKHGYCNLSGCPMPRDPSKCYHHPDRFSVTNLDGENLCEDCANDWVRGEGDAAREQDEYEHEASCMGRFL